jgi:hypothetical protein
MAGESGDDLDWIVPAVRDLSVQVARLLEADRRYEERFRASELAVDAAFRAAKEATTKADGANDKRFESVNEFRAQLAFQASSFLTRTEFDAHHSTLLKEHADLVRRVEAMAGREKGTADTRALTIAAIGVLIGLSAIITSIVVAVTH